MSEQYVHLLIPDRADFVPVPQQVAAFLDGLVKLNSAPPEATFKVGKLSGKVRTGVNALTGEKISTPRRDFASFGSVSDILGQLVAMEDYDVVVSGEGPAEFPPFTLYSTTGWQQSEFKGTYSYEVRCCLRAEVVSTCETPPFGSQCPSEMRIGAFRNPSTGTLIEVPNAGCARFWIEFQFGKWLVPRIGDNLNLLEPSVLANATNSFGMGFA